MLGCAKEMRRALIVVGKAPQPGRAKTRLVPPLTFEAAAALYRGFLLDTVELGLRLDWERVSVVHPRDAGPSLRELLPRQINLVQQPADGLGAALAHAFQNHLAEGFERVVLIGSDNPTLPDEPIRQACAALDAYDVVIGPCIDGGYYLIGMRQPQLGLFQNIAWSTSRVYAQTLERAAELRLRIKAVQEWYDVDEPPDLDRLYLELASSPVQVAPNTRSILDQIYPGGTSTDGERPEREAYTVARRSATSRPAPARAKTTTEPPKPPPVMRAP